MGLGGPIIIEEFLEVDHLSSPSFLHPPEMSPVHLNLDVQLGSRRNISAYAQASVSVCGEERRDPQALGWCPGLVVFPL